MTSTRRRSRREEGISLIVASVALVMLVPMTGLAIDVSLLYVTKARLQGAVDGASLAAARALTLGATLSAQETSAKQNAVTWFFGNFPSGNWGTYGTQMDSSDTHVHVYPDSTYPALEHVNVMATTNAPTYFMKWFNFSYTVIGATGNSSRRAVVIMMVLDRSGSMLGTPCANLKSAAKLFTGTFAAGRDQIGLISFSDGSYLHTAPTTNFQTVLGYTNGTTVVNGAIDAIQCGGGTGTPEAIALAYNEMQKINLPGALNLILLETDGLPNTLNMNFAPALDIQSYCTDKNGKTRAQGGWTSGTDRAWTPGFNMSVGGSGYEGNIPAGAIATLWSADPSMAKTFGWAGDPYPTSGNPPGGNLATMTGCTTGNLTDVIDLDWIPASDVYGNTLAPTLNPYKPVTTTSGHVAFTGGTVPEWTNYHNAVLNATDNAAYKSRNSGTLPIAFYVVGLGGSADPPDLTLMQRIANDPGPDSFNATAQYLPCAQTPNCITYPSQPEGQLIYSADSTKLSAAFGALASQILRLNQ